MTGGAGTGQGQRWCNLPPVLRFTKAFLSGVGFFLVSPKIIHKGVVESVNLCSFGDQLHDCKKMLISNRTQVKLV